jgi:hypothetical protein
MMQKWIYNTTHDLGWNGFIEVGSIKERVKIK